MNLLTKIRGPLKKRILLLLKFIRKVFIVLIVGWVHMDIG